MKDIGVERIPGIWIKKNPGPLKSGTVSVKSKKKKKTKFACLRCKVPVNILAEIDPTQFDGMICDRCSKIKR